MQIKDEDLKNAHLVYKVWDSEEDKFVGKQSYARSKKLGQVYSSKYHAENRAKKMNRTYANGQQMQNGGRFIVISCVIMPMHERTFKMKKAEVI